MNRLAFVLGLGLVVLVACSRAPRGDSCKSDGDCEKGLECLAAGPASPSFCTTRCRAEDPKSCPTGWSCIELEHFSGLFACARS